MNRVKLHKPKAQTLTVASCYSDEILEAQIVTFKGADTREGLLRDQAQFRDLARYLWREQARSRTSVGTGMSQAWPEISATAGLNKESPQV